MSSVFLTTLGYGLFCGIALLMGAIISTRWTPTPLFRSYIQHFAAGLVFAAVGAEVLPDLLHRNLPWAAAVGFCIGVGLMLAIASISEKMESGEKKNKNNWSLIGVVTTDIFIDGLLIGVASAVAVEGGQQALLVTIALATEMLALGLSLGCTLDGDGLTHAKVIKTGAVMALAPLLGTIMGFLLGGAVEGIWIEGILAFAAAALMYLAVEELMKEAHETKETPIANMLFFGAFLAILLVDMLGK